MTTQQTDSAQNDAFVALSTWIDRQQKLKHGSDFQLADQALNLPIMIHFDTIDGLNQIEAWGLRVSLVHLRCFTQQIVPTDRSVRITLPLPGRELVEIAGRIVYCSKCLEGIYQTGLVLDWESLEAGNKRAISVNGVAGA